MLAQAFARAGNLELARRAFQSIPGTLDRALPAGPWIEFHHKRPVMIWADLARAGALLSIPAALVLGVLSYAQLVVVAVVQAVGAIVFTAASGAHISPVPPKP